MKQTNSDPFELAKQYHQSGDWTQAEAFYRRALEKHPEPFKVYNNLGTLFEDQGRLDEAIAILQAGVEKNPDCYMLHYNLAHAYHRSERLGEALFSYMKAIDLEPDCCETHYNLGNLLMEQGRYQSAVESYRRAIGCHPNFREAHANLGAALYELNQLEDAAASYEDAIYLASDTSHEHVNLGKIYVGLGRIEDAIAAYEKSLEQRRDNSAGYLQLAMLLQGLERDYELDHILTCWETNVEHDPIREHFIAAYTGESIAVRAPDAFVQALFDNYSTEYDNAMTVMRYRVPPLMVGQMAKLYGEPDRQLQILELGCGTGIVGQLMRPYAKRIVGVDLSLEMLQRAMNRGLSHLIHDEMLACLAKATDHYDLIVAADSLIYMGDLADAFSAVHKSLKPAGQFMFSLEAIEAANTSDDFFLHRRGHYAHAAEYVGLQLQRTGFEVVSLEKTDTRTEAARKVEGLIVVARRGE